MRSGRYLLACGFCKRRLRVKFNSSRGLVLNLNFVLADLLLNFIIAVLPIKFCRYAGLALKELEAVMRNAVKFYFGHKELSKSRFQEASER